MRIASFVRIVLLACCCRVPSVWGDDAAAWQLPKLPKAHFVGNLDWYPETWKQRGLEGRVLIAFDISPAGKASNIVAIWSEHPEMEAQTIQMLKGASFRSERHPQLKLRQIPFRLGPQDR